MRLRAAGRTLTLGELRLALEDCSSPLFGWDENAPVTVNGCYIEVADGSPSGMEFQSGQALDAEELGETLAEAHDLIRQIADGDLKGVAIRKRCAELLDEHLSKP